MGGLHKRSEAGLVIILILVIAALFFGWLININQRECNHNKDCGSEAYCGSDFSCHNYPTIQKTVVQYNLFWSAVIIGIAIVIAAIIVRRNKIMSKEKVIEKHKIDTKASEEELEEVVEPYYKNIINIKTP